MKYIIYFAIGVAVCCSSQTVTAQSKTEGVRTGFVKRFSLDRNSVRFGRTTVPDSLYTVEQVRNYLGGEFHSEYIFELSCDTLKVQDVSPCAKQGIRAALRIYFGGDGKPVLYWAEESYMVPCPKKADSPTPYTRDIRAVYDYWSESWLK